VRFETLRNHGFSGGDSASEADEIHASNANGCAHVGTISSRPITAGARYLETRNRRGP
jgi:hypothetical protein